MSTIELPRGFEFGTKVEIKKPNTDTILSVYDKAEAGKMYNALLALMEGSIAEIDGVKPTTAMLKKMPIVSAEVVAVEAFKLYKVPTLVEGVYPCPRCGHQVIHEQNKDEDTRDDVASLPIVYDRKLPTPNEYNHEEGYYRLELSDDEKLQFGETTFINAEVFRDPTIEDMIDIQNDMTLKSPSSQQKKLYFKCLADIEFMDTQTEDPMVIKNRYLYELIRFDDYRTFDRITLGLRRFGMRPFVEMGCPSCKKVWESAIDFTSFFVYALRSNLGSQAKVR